MKTVCYDLASYGGGFARFAPRFSEPVVVGLPIRPRADRTKLECTEAAARRFIRKGKAQATLVYHYGNLALDRTVCVERDTLTTSARQAGEVADLMYQAYIDGYVLLVQAPVSNQSRIDGVRDKYYIAVRTAKKLPEDTNGQG